MTIGAVYRVTSGYRVGQTGTLLAITQGRARLRLTSTGQTIAVPPSQLAPVDTTRPLSAAAARERRAALR